MNKNFIDKIVLEAKIANNELYSDKPKNWQEVTEKLNPVFKADSNDIGNSRNYFIKSGMLGGAGVGRTTLDRKKFD